MPRTLSLLFLMLVCVACGEAAPELPDATPIRVAGRTSVAVASVTPALPAATETPSPAATPTPVPTTRPAATPSPTSTPFRFAVIGDFGQAGTPEADVAALVQSWRPDFIVTTGDNNYPNGKAETIDANIGQYYADYIFPYYGGYTRTTALEVNRFFPVPGNHDDDNEAGLQPYLAYFTLPGNERYYEVVWPPVHLFALNSNGNEPDGFRLDSAQAAWLQERLAASTMPWRLVILHVAPYSSGFHGSNGARQWPFQEWGASAVLAGHDHLYERLLVDGLPYFVNGLGGYPAIYAFEEILPESQARYREDYGAMRVEATDTTITFEFISREGDIIDSYKLTK